jgi:hypothetical protein
VKKTRQIKNLEPRSDSIGTEKATGSVPDAQSITNRHKAANAVAHPAGIRLNKADHSARANRGITGDFPTRRTRRTGEGNDDLR